MTFNIPQHIASQDWENLDLIWINVVSLHENRSGRREHTSLMTEGVKKAKAENEVVVICEL